MITTTELTITDCIVIHVYSLQSSRMAIVRLDRKRRYPPVAPDLIYIVKGTPVKDQLI